MDKCEDGHMPACILENETNIISSHGNAQPSRCLKIPGMSVDSILASLGHPTHGSLSEVNCPHGGILVRIEGVEFLIGP